MFSIPTRVNYRMPKFQEERKELEKKKELWEWEGNSSVIQNTEVVREDGLKVAWCQSLDDVPDGITESSAEIY